jgi:small subunit ribosomal protein S27e
MLKLPKSKFYTVECECGNKITVFSHSANIVKCKKCGKTIVEPTGGKVKIYSKIIETHGAYS